MAQLPDRVLSWLWTVLQPYRHPRSTYSDTVSVLSVFPSLQPRTAVYTYEDGHSALLLCLGGTLPVDFRGTLYRYPVELWLPEEYGERGTGVICYVRPDGGKTGSKGDFVTRPGQHVAVDGRVYHPYLRDWGTREVSVRKQTYIHDLESSICSPRQADACCCRNIRLTLTCRDPISSTFSVSSRMSLRKSLLLWQDSTISSSVSPHNHRTGRHLLRNNDLDPVNPWKCRALHSHLHYLLSLDSSIEVLRS